jgi:uncharacterized protein
MLTLAVVVGSIIMLAVAARLLERRIAFLPVAGTSATPAGFGVRFDSLTLTTSDGEQLSAWSLPHPAPRALILYFHGNGGNLSMWAPILVNIQRQGYAVLAVDYRGYGESTGTPSEQGLYKDVESALDWMGTIPADRAVPVLYWGRSLGATMAAYAAAVRPPDALILESGFPSARALLRGSPVLALLGMFSSYRFPTTDLLKRVQRPTLVIHGDADRVVPFRLGRALYEGIGGPKEFLTIRGGDHNDLLPRDPDAYWNAIERFMTGLRTRRSE